MTDSAPLSMRRFVSSDIASIESTTPAIDSRPTSGTMIGGCGVMPENTRQLWRVIERLSYFGGHGWYSNTMLDLLIIGAGPAGSFAAELLARGGTKVALFDGRPEGEPKACGGGVTGKALKAWPQLLNAVGRTITELDLYSPSGKRLHLALDEPFAIYSRIAFDCYLLNSARDAGAHVISEKISARKTKRSADGWRVISDTGSECTGSFLVGADGANSGI